jgi:hypothetical protein
MEQELRHRRLHPGVRGFDALLVGFHEKKDLIFAAKVAPEFAGPLFLAGKASIISLMQRKGLTP